jgi:hypothetical protein
MTLSPSDNVFPLPDPAHGQHRLWFGEISVRLEQLVNPLT